MSFRHKEVPELRPLERRRARAAARDEAQAKNGDEPLICFAGPLFGGCTICAVHDDDFIRQRPTVERIHDKWEGEVFCSTSEHRSCSGKKEEFVEEVEDSTSLGDDDEGSESPDSQRRPRALPSAAARAWDPRLVHRGVDEGQDSNLQREIESVIWNAGDVFVTKGWDLVHRSCDRYSLNGRSIKLSLMPPSVPLPYFTHLLKVVDYDTAERAARIMVCDGPLHQPLLDYLMHTGQNESYDERGTENIAGVTGGGKLLDFNIAPTSDRILEMRSATIQADMRRSAGGEYERISALQSEGVKLLGSRPPGGSVSLSREPSRSLPLPLWEAAIAREL